MIKTSTINLYGIPQSVNLMVKHVDAVSNTAPGTPAATVHLQLQTLLLIEGSCSSQGFSSNHKLMQCCCESHCTQAKCEEELERHLNAMNLPLRIMRVKRIFWLILLEFTWEFQKPLLPLSAFVWNLPVLSTGNNLILRMLQRSKVRS